MARKPAGISKALEGSESRTLLSHRKTEAQHARGLDRLVGLELGTRQGEPFDHMRIDFELSCGEASLKVGNNGYGLLLRSCFVVIAREQCELKPLSRYEYRLSEGSVDITSSSTTNSERGHHVEGGIQAEVSARPSAFLKSKFFFGIKGQRGSSTKQEDKTKRMARVDVITTSGQDRWRVGDPVTGDPRHPNGTLSGNYFGERRDPEGEPLPLCILAGTSGSAMLTASVTAELGQFLVFKNGVRTQVQELESLEPALRRRSTVLEKSHAERKAVLRAAVAGLVAATVLREAQAAVGLRLGTAEFAIAQQTMALQASAPPTGGES